MVSLPRQMAKKLADIQAVCRTEKDPAMLWEHIREMILEVVPGDLGAFAIKDPVSGLILDGYGYGDPALNYKYISEFYLKREMHHHLEQRTHGVVISHVSQYTGGKLERDPVYRDWLRYEGYKHGVRVSFVAGGYYWGRLCCIRGDDTPDFNEKELTFLQALAEPVGTALRNATTWHHAHSPPAQGAALPDAAVLCLDKQHRVLFRTDGTEFILGDIVGPDGADIKGRVNRIGGALPASVMSVCARLRAALNSDESTISPRITMQGRTQWWTLTATVPEQGMSEKVATVIIVARAHPRDTASVLLAAYNLTPREEEILNLVRLGLSTAAMAKKLYVSRYTVQDHLKSIFSKTGVTSRGELMAVIFREESPIGRSIALSESRGSATMDSNVAGE